MIINENGYNKVQINTTIDRAPDGTVIRRTLMINLREETVEKCFELYSALQKKLESEEKPKKKDKKKGQSNSKETAENKAPLCPIHQVPMLLKQNKNNGNLFWGCPNWQPGGKGCNETMLYLSEKESEEDMIELEEIQV